MLPGSRRRNQRKVEEQRVSLLGEESPGSANTRLTAWTTSTVDTDEDFSGLFPEDPFKRASTKKIQAAKQSARAGTEVHARDVTPEDLLKVPKPTGRRRRKNYEGESEPDGVRGQEAQVSQPRRSSKSPGDDDLPAIRSFSGSTPPSSSSSLRFVSPESQEHAPPTRQSSRRRETEDTRSPRLELLPVSETSIPEGEEEESTDGESSTDRHPNLRNFAPGAKMQSIEEYSPQDVRDVHSSLDIRKFAQGNELSDSASPPTPRMRKLPEHQQMTSKSTSSEDLREMMPDLIPTPPSSQTTGRSSRSSDGNVGSYNRSVAVESPSNDTNDANYINSLEKVEAVNAKAVEHVEHGEYDLALAAFEQVLATYKEMHGDSHPLVASTYHNLGMVHSKRAALLLDGTFHQNHCRQQSLECFQAAARTGRDSLGPNHPNVAVSLVRIGFLLLQARQYQNAFVTFKEALRIRLAHYGKDVPHSLVANLYNNLGVCKMHMEQYKEGSTMLKTALEIQRKVLRTKRQEKNVSRTELRNCLLEIADTLCNLGGLYLEWIRQQGPDPRNTDEAEAAFAEALEVSLEHDGNIGDAFHGVFYFAKILFFVCIRFGLLYWDQGTNLCTKYGLCTKWHGRRRCRLLYPISIVE